MASAFIIEVNSQLQPDPNDETAALLRVLIYKIDNTTFGDTPPTLPQWTGPPYTIVQVQAILFASLAASLFSSLLAMLGKQWLNQYASIDMRGSAIERSQNRQRKLDGIITWYFNHVMELLPLMLQAALLLLGCALSRYLWEINTTVASVVLAITSFGVLFYLFIIFVGAASVSCPYQTPGSHLLRRILDTPYHIDAVSGLTSHLSDHIQGFFRCISGAIRRCPDTFRRIPHTTDMLYSVLSTPFKQSMCCRELDLMWEYLRYPKHYSPRGGVALVVRVLPLPMWLVVDSCRVVFWPFVLFARMVQRRSERLAGALDQCCISWTLRTSLDGPVRLSTLNYLSTMTLVDLDPAIVVDCFDILFGCIMIIEGKITVAQGMEELAAVSALCCLRMISHLTITDPKSRVLGNARQRYGGTVGTWVDVITPPLSPALGIMHYMFNRVVEYFPRVWGWDRLHVIQWEGYEPSNNEHAITAHALIVIARFERRRRGKVPRWLLRFALHSLSRSPPPSTSVATSCLSIIAIGLYRDPPATTILGDRCVRI